MGNQCNKTDDGAGVISAPPCEDKQLADGSFSCIPDRSCEYTMRLAKKLLNTDTYLHEFGHALGLAHEHVRDDAGSCRPDTIATWKGGAKITAYNDTNSVMWYSLGICPWLSGNLGTEGLSNGDRLAVEIMA
jgi:hypothetical protein